MTWLANNLNEFWPDMLMDTHLEPATVFINRYLATVEVYTHYVRPTHALGILDVDSEPVMHSVEPHSSNALE